MPAPSGAEVPLGRGGRGDGRGSERASAKGIVSALATRQTSPAHPGTCPLNPSQAHLHRVGLAGARLAVAEEAHRVAVQRRLHELRDLGEHGGLAGVGAEHLVEGEGVLLAVEAERERSAAGEAADNAAGVGAHTAEDADLRGRGWGFGAGVWGGGQSKSVEGRSAAASERGGWTVVGCSPSAPSARARPSLTLPRSSTSWLCSRRRVASASAAATCSVLTRSSRRPTTSRCSPCAELEGRQLVKALPVREGHRAAVSRIPAPHLAQGFLQGLELRLEVQQPRRARARLGLGRAQRLLRLGHARLQRLGLGARGRLRLQCSRSLFGMLRETGGVGEASMASAHAQQAWPRRSVHPSPHASTSHLRPRRLGLLHGRERLRLGLHLRGLRGL
jgi:hypothetical protein